MTTLRNYITPLTAYECLKDKLVFDIDKKRSIELKYGDKISFLRYEELISDTIVRGLLPRRYSGLESKNVIVITSNDEFDFYQCVNVAKKKYGMDINTVLDRTIIIRVFTIYQLAETIVYELSRLVSKFKSKLLVVISDLFIGSHIKNQNIDHDDKKLLVRFITESLNNIVNAIVVIFSSTSIPNIRNYQKNSEFENRDEL